jgi:hypothetical protein
VENNVSQTGTFERVAECFYRYPTSGTYFALLKVGGRQTRINLQTLDLATAKRKRDTEKAKQALSSMRAFLESLFEPEELVAIYDCRESDRKTDSTNAQSILPELAQRERFRS